MPLISHPSSVFKQSIARFNTLKCPESWFIKIRLTSNKEIKTTTVLVVFEVQTYRRGFSCGKF